MTQKYEYRCPHCGELIDIDALKKEQREKAAEIQKLYDVRNERIYAQWNEGVSRKQLSEMYNLTEQSVVRAIHNGSIIAARKGRAKNKQEAEGN